MQSSATVAVGPHVYEITATPDGGSWIATATRAGTGKPFGIAITGDTAEASCQRLARWLEWQHAHTEALRELQEAEHAYHRTIAGSAFASSSEGPSPLEMQKESLEIVEAARRRLDEIRQQRPE